MSMEDTKTPSDNFCCPTILEEVLEQQKIDAYLDSDWPIGESEKIFLDDSSELRISEASSKIQVDKFTFSFDDNYADKTDRLSKLRCSLENMLTESWHIESFFTKGLVTNHFETLAIIDSFKAANFQYSCFFFFFENNISKKGMSSFDCKQNIIQLQEKMRENKKNGITAERKRHRFTLFGKTFFLQTTAEVIVFVLESIYYLTTGLESNDAKWKCSWTKDFNHARYRIAKHLLKCKKYELVKQFCLCQLQPYLSKPYQKRLRMETGEEKVQKKTKLEFTAVKSSQKFMNTNDIENVQENVHENAQEAPTDETLQSEEEPAEDCHDRVEIDINHVVEEPELTFSGGKKRRNAETEDILDENGSQFHYNESHFRGRKRFADVKTVWKERHESRSFETKIWIWVCLVAVFLECLTLLLSSKIIPIILFNEKRTLQVVVLIVLLLVIIWAATYHRKTPKNNILIFVVYTLSSLWVGATHKACSFPALSYFCCALTVLLFKKKWLLLIPFFIFAVAVILGTVFDHLEPVSTVCKCFITGFSFYIQYRQQSNSITSILMAPIRDVCFVLIAPIAIVLMIEGSF